MNTAAQLSLQGMPVRDIANSYTCRTVKFVQSQFVSFFRARGHSERQACYLALHATFIKMDKRGTDISQSQIGSVLHQFFPLVFKKAVDQTGVSRLQAAGKLAGLLAYAKHVNWGGVHPNEARCIKRVGYTLEFLKMVATFQGESEKMCTSVLHMQNTHSSPTGKFEETITEENTRRAPVRLNEPPAEAGGQFSRPQECGLQKNPVQLPIDSESIQDASPGNYSKQSPPETQLRVGKCKSDAKKNPKSRPRINKQKRNLTRIQRSISHRIQTFEHLSESEGRLLSGLYLDNLDDDIFIQLERNWPEIKTAPDDWTKATWYGLFRTSIIPYLQGKLMRNTSILKSPASLSLVPAGTEIFKEVPDKLEIQPPVLSRTKPIHQPTPVKLALVASNEDGAGEFFASVSDEQLELKTAFMGVIQDYTGEFTHLVREFRESSKERQREMMKQLNNKEIGPGSNG